MTVEAQSLVQHEMTETLPYVEPNPQELNLQVLQENLGNCLSIIDDEVMKGYITKLEQLPIMDPGAYRLDQMEELQFFRITELVYQEDEFSVDKLSMMFHALSGFPCTLVLMLQSDGAKTNFYLGARSNNAERSTGTMRNMLEKTLKGFFPGSKIEKFFSEDCRNAMQAAKVDCISSVTSVADYKRNEDSVTNKDFVQGLEKFVYAMKGASYTAIFLADSVDHDQLMVHRREYEKICTELTPFVDMQMNFTVSDGQSTSAGISAGKTFNTAYTDSKGKTESKTETESETKGTSDTHTTTQSTAEGKIHTTGTADGTSRTVTNTGTVGVNHSINHSINGGIKLGPLNIGGSKGSSTGVFGSISHSVAKGTTHTDSVSDSVSKTLSHGFSDSHGTSETREISRGSSTGTTETQSVTTGEAFNLVDNRMLTDTFGSSRGVTLNTRNMTLASVLKRLEKQLERIDECESIGMWNFAAYFMGETPEVQSAANTYKAVVAGVDSGIECSAVNLWMDRSNVKMLETYLQNFVHPQFLYQGFSYNEPRQVAVDPSALVSTNELALHMGLPRHSVQGLPVVEHASFAQEVVLQGQTRAAQPVQAGPEDEMPRVVNLGSLYHLGESTDAKVKLDVESMAMHTFVTGSTGSGKSNAAYHLLAELRKHGISSLVVEPAKGEYKNVFPYTPCYGTNPKLGRLLRINPFAFPEQVHMLEHIDRIVEIFNVCWPMYAAMPAVLKDAVEQAYVAAGWNLEQSENESVPGLFPTFADVLRELQNVIHSSEYSSDTKGDYIGSLSTRLKSLTNGINGLIFVSREMNLADLFDKDAIVDLSRVGSTETKSLIMGLLGLKLQEYRMANAKGMNEPLKHVTVLEEAHNLLKKTSTEQSTETANVVGKSVEMLTSAIAEVRTYGEGFIIVDQAPDLLDTAVIRNTNTKIVLRLPEKKDREVTGGAMGLNDAQLEELSRIPTGMAAVYQNNWQEAVLCQLPKYQLYGRRKQECEESFQSRTERNNATLHFLLADRLSAAQKEKLALRLKNSNAAAKTVRMLLEHQDSRDKQYQWAVADFIASQYVLPDVFRGTAACQELRELENILQENLSEIFRQFSAVEIRKITAYVCMTESEKHPERKSLEQLCAYYWKEKVL